jgi:phage/plasmid-associated DNA primase
MQCNDKPNLGKIDGGLVRRIKIIPYIYSFVVNPKKSYEKMIDDTIKDKMKNQIYVNEFMLMLLEKAKETKSIKAKDIVIPEDSKQAVNEYIEENNPLKVWMDENIIYTDNKNDMILMGDLLNAYHECYKF